MRRWRPSALREPLAPPRTSALPTADRTRHFTPVRVAPGVRRRALLAALAGGGTGTLAGCPTPPWGEDPTAIDGADVTFRRDFDGDIDATDSSSLDVAELGRDLDRDPPRLFVRGKAMGGARDCYRVSLVEATRSAERLSLRLTVEEALSSTVQMCGDIAEPHPYSVAVAFADTPVPERVAVRHGDETILEETV